MTSVKPCYIAFIASATQEAVWIRKLLTDLEIKPSDPTLILEDNQSAISMAKSPQFHGRAKHVDIRYHFVGEQVARGAVNLEYCKSVDMVAGMLTKGLDRLKFCKHREHAGIYPLSYE